MKKLSATTLQETVVALTVVLICFSIALMVFVNVMRTEKAYDHLKADLIMREAFIDTKINRQFFNDEIRKGNFIIVKTIQDHPVNTSLAILEIRVLKNGKVLKEDKELYIKYDDK